MIHKAGPAGRGPIVCLLLAALSWASGADGARLYVDAFKFSDPAFETSIQVDLSDVTDVTGAGATAADSTAVALDTFAPKQFAARLGPFGSFTDFRDATVGNWRLTVEFSGGGQAAYDFVVNDFRTPFISDSFPPAPTMTSPMNGAVDVNPTPTFDWDNGGPHTGSLESLFVSVWSRADPTTGEFASSTGGAFALSAETWTPSVVLPPGAAAFLVQYETNENEDANVEDPIFDTGGSTVADPGIVWNSSSGDLFSRDLIDFTVIPEPATLSLLVLGGLVLLKRRGR